MFNRQVIETIPVNDDQYPMDTIVLSTMTLDGQISNVKFDKITAIEHLQLTDSVVEIGCNYGYKILEEYKSMSCYKDRMKKKQKRNAQTSNKRKQGLGTHFNSQITFTLTTEIDKDNSYQVKLFTNGRIQIPGIGKLSKRNDELIEDILNKMISYIMLHENTLMLNKENECQVQYLIPILQNYKSKTLMAPDCTKKEKFITEFGTKFIITPNLDLLKLERIIVEYREKHRFNLLIDSVSFYPERYAGMLIKFSTPKIITGSYKLDKFIEMVKLIYHRKAKKSKCIKPNVAYKNICPIADETADDMTDDEITKQQYRKMDRIVKTMQYFWYENNKSTPKYRKKLTTVKLFKSGKINLDHVNSTEEAIMARKFVVDRINEHWDEVVYYDQ